MGIQSQPTLETSTIAEPGCGAGEAIRLHADVLPVAVPPGHVGPVVLPGSGRLVWWTGRVAIGLRHERAMYQQAPSSSALWVQDLLLAA